MRHGIINATVRLALSKIQLVDQVHQKVRGYCWHHFTLPGNKSNR